MVKGCENKRGQVTIFIIIALVLVALVGGYFILKNVIKNEVVPESVSPIQVSFLSCLEEAANTGISLVETTGGYIDLPTFEPGSRYQPFSSQLTFAGVEIPYWYYMSGSNFPRENVPSKEFIEDEIAKFVERRIISCDLDRYVDEGFIIFRGNPTAEVLITNGEVKVNLKMDLTVEKGTESFLIKDHEFVVKSVLGELYEASKEVYEQEQNSLFLENYSVDVLRLYAPVDGVELTCSPMTWEAEGIFQDLREALEVNILSLKNEGDKKDYFLVEDLPKNVDVNFLTSQTWPNTFEVNPTEGSLLISKPVGNQNGLGILGFCYVPYHYVYNVRYPVLVQVSKGEEIFQFPVAVLIEGNLPRKAKEGNSIAPEIIDLCTDKNSPTTINVFDTNLNSVDAKITYECFGSRCDLGNTNDGELRTLLPQCVNGNLIIEAEGYRELRSMYSSVRPGSEVVILDREYEKEIGLTLGGQSVSQNALVSFIGEEDVQTINYPETKKIKLGEGSYEIQVTIYGESTVSFGETIEEQCVTVPQSGVGGFIGLEKTECFEVIFPAQDVTDVLIGGGNLNYYFFDQDLENSGKIQIEVPRLETPKTLEELQQNYLLFEVSELEVTL